MSIHDFNSGDTVKVTNERLRYTTHIRAYASVAYIFTNDIEETQLSSRITIKKGKVLSIADGDTLTVVANLEHLDGIVVCKKPGSNQLKLENLIAIETRGIVKVETITKVEAEKRLGCIISG